MNQSEEAKSNLSPTQKKKIEEKLENIGDEIKKYPIYQDFEDDKNLC